MRSVLLENLEVGIQAEIVPERGALLTSLKNHGEEYLYFDEEDLSSPDRPHCGMPVLFPCCGRNADETVAFDGRAYHMPIHGFAHTSPWEIQAHGTDERGAWVALELQDTPETQSMYPFSFSLSLTLRIWENQLRVEHECVNRGERPMPFDLGYHPYFLMSGLQNVEFRVPGRQPALTLPDGPETGAQLSHPPSGTLFCDRARRTTVVMHHTEGFDSLVLWSVPAKGFVCMEPWQGMPNGLNGQPSMVLMPGRSARGAISLIPGILP